MATIQPESDIEQKAQDFQAVQLESATISDEHRAYLLERHGTIKLEPLPEMDDADPYNWPSHKKIINLILVAFHGMMATFTAAAIQSAFENISLDLDISIQQASYLTSLVIAVIGVAPLLWRPIMDRFGRRPIFLLSLLGSLIGNIGCAESHSYGTMGLCRAITGLFICPAAATGSAVVAECFFKHQRGRYMGIWTLMVTLGVPVAPFIFGFVALRVGYRWIYWVLACTNAVQFILYIFLGPETRYLRSHDIKTPSRTNGMFRFRRIDPTSLKMWDFVSPLRLFAVPCVLIPAVSYSMVFLIAGILPTIEIPQLFVEEFGFNPQQVGLQNASVIIGSILGEQIGGILSDQWMKQQRKTPRPEFRLWLSYIGYALAIAGIVVFLVCLQQAGHTWNVKPLVGVAFASGGNQIVTTVLITYAVDCYHHEAAEIGVFITFVRQVWGFIGPFWFPAMIASAGLGGSAGIATGMIVVASVLPTILLQRQGPLWRKHNTDSATP